jgi:hypothetical protein
MIPLGPSGLVLHIEDDATELAISVEGHPSEEALLQVLVNRTGVIRVSLGDTTEEGRDLLQMTVYQLLRGEGADADIWEKQ